MIAWLIVLCLLALVLCMPVGGCISWENNDFLLKIRIGFLRFSLPVRDEAEPVLSNKSAPEKGKKKKSLNPTVKKWLKALCENRDNLFSLIGKVLRSPTLNLLRLHIAVGAPDPAACAMTYERICAGISAGLPVVQNTFRVKKQDINVSCCFDQPETKIEVQAEATLKVYEVFALAGTALGLLFKLVRSTKTMDKAVQHI